LPEIALFLCDEMTALDAVGPYEGLARLPDADARFVAATPGRNTTDVGLVLTADSALEDVPAPDVIRRLGRGRVPFMNETALRFSQAAWLSPSADSEQMRKGATVDEVVRWDRAAADRVVAAGDVAGAYGEAEAAA
jgi:hypothetical protein